MSGSNVHGSRSNRYAVVLPGSFARHLTARQLGQDTDLARRFKNRLERGRPWLCVRGIFDEDEAGKMIATRAPRRGQRDATTQTVSRGRTCQGQHVRL